MAKLFFRYGAMGASKSTQLLVAAYNYEEKGQRVLVMKPALDDRDGQDTITSGIGKVVRKVDYLLHPEDNVLDILLQDLNGFKTPPACVLVDEAQFLTKDQIWQLAGTADNGIPVICYGIRTDFKARLFPGSEALMALADSIEEIKTICWCGKKAIINARIHEGHVVLEGDQVLIGGKSVYSSLCRKHWLKDQIQGEAC